MRRKKPLVITGIVLVVIGLIVYGICNLAFRGAVVRIPAAHVGRVKTVSGFQEDARQPATFRLPWNWFGMTPSNLVTAELSDHRIEEKIPTLFMPSDKLNLELQIVGTFRVRDDKESIDALYDRLIPVPVAGVQDTHVIGFNQVYAAYGQQVVRTTGQEVVAKYSIQYVLENLDSVSKEIEDKINERLKASKAPLVAKYCGLGTVQPPELIVQAQEKAKQREIDIATAEASKLVALTKADADYQVGLKQQEIELLEAETQVLVDLLLSDAVSEAFIAQRSLKVLESLAANPNTTLILSTKVFSDPETLLGLSHLDGLKRDTAATKAQLDEAMRRIDDAKKEAAKRMREEHQVPPAPAVVPMPRPGAGRVTPPAGGPSAPANKE